MPKKQLSYSESIVRIEEIVSQIENGQADIDDLSSLVKEATELIVACKSKLKQTESELNDTLNSID